jgi:hypothetical protein
VCDPNTVSSSLPAETLDSDFTFVFAASQGIVTPSNHSKQFVIGYKGTACQVLIHPNTVPTIPEMCLSTAKSTPKYQISTAHLGIKDSGYTDHFIQEKSYFISYTAVTGKLIMMANGTSIPVMGICTISLNTNGVPVCLVNCYHTPGLRASLYSPRRHRRSIGCAFVGDQQGMYLTLGNIHT